MSDFNQLEQAQLGLQYIEDAVVTLLTRHPAGLPIAVVADMLGLSADLDPRHRNMLASGILELLKRNGRILWDEARGVYVDNPDRG
jgi:hypothetical protein